MSGTSPGSRLLTLPGNLPWRRFGWGLVFLLLWAAVFYVDLSPRALYLQEGQAAPDTVRAPRTAVDRIRTEQLRQEAAASVPEVYDLDPRATAEADKAVADIFARTRELAAQAGSLRERAQTLAGELGLPSRDPAAAALSADAATLDKLEAWAHDITISLLQAGIKEENLEASREQVRKKAEELVVPRELKQFVAAVVAPQLRPNLVFNAQETEGRRQQARDAVQPVMVQRGDVVLRKGEVVTAAHLTLLRDLGLTKAGGGWLLGAGAILLSGLMVGTVAVYLRTAVPAVWNAEHLLVLTGLVLSVALVLAHLTRGLSGHLAPVATASVLLSVLVRTDVAVMTVPVLALANAAANGLQAEFGVTAFFGALAGAYGLGRLTQRTDFMRAGFLAGLGQLAAAIALTLVGAVAQEGVELGRAYLFAFLSGPLSGILAVGLLPFLEAAFGVVTPIKLLELSNPNHPLLRRLLVEAPGTYHHSILVANLADAGAEAVGADALLARVGAYYHDIGKVKRPYFFIENQLGQENPHDKMSPALSAVVITAHVKDGLELAREYRLPATVSAFIAEHHGTALVSYFYSRAAQQDGPRVEEEGFRYDTPRPRSRETAIVMLADAVEAAVRALPDPTPAAIEAVVAKIIGSRLQDRQLDEAPLTLRDLDAISRAFVRVLSGIYHPRIEYPEEKGGSGERKGENTRRDNQTARALPAPGDDRPAAAGGDADIRASESRPGEEGRGGE